MKHLISLFGFFCCCCAASIELLVPNLCVMCSDVYRLSLIESVMLSDLSAQSSISEHDH